MTEYEELREKIAIKLSNFTLAILGGRLAGTTLECEREASEILSIIAERCWFKDEGDMWIDKGREIMLAWGYGFGVSDTTVNSFIDAGWRPVKEIKKEK